jgi:hypothetical protein
MGDMATLLCVRLGVSNSVACHSTHSCKVLNAAWDRRNAPSSHKPRDAFKYASLFCVSPEAVRLRIYPTIRRRWRIKGTEEIAHR